MNNSRSQYLIQKCTNTPHDNVQFSILIGAVLDYLMQCSKAVHHRPCLVYYVE